MYKYRNVLKLNMQNKTTDVLMTTFLDIEFR